MRENMRAFPVLALRAHTCAMCRGCRGCRGVSGGAGFLLILPWGPAVGAVGVSWAR